MARSARNRAGRVGAPDAFAPGTLPSLRERGLFKDRGDFLRVDDEGAWLPCDLRHAENGKLKLGRVRLN